METPFDVREAGVVAEGLETPHGWDERHLARLARAQDGIVEAWQLAALGMTPRQRRTRVGQQRLVVEHRGVYSVGGGALTERARFRAAVAARGRAALLSHLSAARLLGLWERPIASADVTVPRPRHPRRPGIRVHQTNVLMPVDETHVRGIPCTSVSRTIVDLAGALTPSAVEVVFELAERRGQIQAQVLEDLLRRRRRAPGAGVVRGLLETHRPRSGATRSILERRLLAAIRRAGLPEPVVNRPLELGGQVMRPDLMWPAHRVLVELDGRETHGTRRAMRRDRARDRRSTLAGWIPLRFTWDDVAQDISSVLADIREALDVGDGRQAPHEA